MPHTPAPLPANEEHRALSLEHLEVLDSAAEQGFDDIVLLAQTLCQTPIALVSLVDRERQWFKARLGLDVCGTHRDLAFCAHAILAPQEVLVVEDTLLDPRFAESPLVLGAPFIRFYAGAPIVSDAGLALGTVCVIDTRPRTLGAAERQGLHALARQTAALLQLRWLNRQREQQAEVLTEELEEAVAQTEQAQASLRHSRRVSSLGMLTASIAHDFNNLLQALSASLQMVHMRARRPLDVERFADTGLQAVEQGRQLVARLMSNVRSDGPEVICLDVSARIEAARSVLARTVSGELDLSFDLAARGWGVMCVEVQLLSVVMNLLANARDALAGPGSVHIATRLVAVEDDLELPEGDYLVLSVADDGPGMNADVAARVFEPFYTTKLAGQGTGLGLAQVQEFASSAGGVARVHSAPGAGTTISLWLRVLGRVESLASPAFG
ncbi:ATP-binding protein [Pseudomonas sp. HR96]|uniref:sensor histidine kinase n=1 Tax=Pseudomonas sp. HR96 TaxID=1027966 RepID=UPI002A7589B3|nr:ATP-binding protein [Pseudomonas sp. HR96]WPP00553.1 ATP-binding protein [Pseudomonas sp. HR96]